MDVASLKLKPKLIKLEIDDKDIVEQYGDNVSFYMKDYMDLSTYFEFFKLQETQDFNQLVTLLRKVILKENGEVALLDDEMLPVDLTVAILNKINDYVGKSNAKAKTKKAGNTQS